MKAGASSRSASHKHRQATTASASTSARATPTPVSSIRLQRKQPQQPASLAPRLHAPTVLSCQQQLAWERDGHIVVQGLLPADDVAQIAKEANTITSRKKLAALQQRVRVLCPGTREAPQTEAAALKLLHTRGTDAVGFLQFFNNWRDSDLIRSIVFSPALTSAAAQLLGAKKLRVYQDCLFLKEPGYSLTNWHSDLRMAPFDTNSFLTAWIPLRPVRGPSPGTASSTAGSRTEGSSAAAPAGRKQGRARSTSPGRGASVYDELEQDSGMLFASGSHRDFAAPFWHNLQSLDLATRGYPLRGTGPMELGDVSFHHGWTLHCAGPQPKGTPPRIALAVSYFAGGARLLRRSSPTVHKHMLHEEDKEGYSDWLPELKDGAVASHPLLPLVYGGKQSKQGAGQAQTL